MTASIPVTQWPVTPYLKACGPPALHAMLPPIWRDLGRAGIGREAQAALAREPLDVAGRDARLDVHAPEQRVELADPVQALEADHDAALDRDRTAREPGAAAARGQRHVVLVAPAHAPPRPRRRVDGSTTASAVPDDAAAHQIGEVAPLRLDERLGCDHVREIHPLERTLCGRQRSQRSEESP